MNEIQRNRTNRSKTTSMPTRHKSDSAWTIIIKTRQISRIRRETHVFEVYLTLSRLWLKSHAFVSTADMFYSSITSMKFHFFGSRK